MDDARSNKNQILNPGRGHLVVLKVH